MDDVDKLTSYIQGLDYFDAHCGVNICNCTVAQYYDAFMTFVGTNNCNQFKERVVSVYELLEKLVHIRDDPLAVEVYAMLEMTEVTPTIDNVRAVLSQKLALKKIEAYRRELQE